MGYGRPWSSHRDNDLSLSVSLFQIPDGFGNLAQRVRPVDDRRDLPRFDELLQELQIVLARLADERLDPLTHEGRQQDSPEHSFPRPEQSTAAYPADDHEY